MAEDRMKTNVKENVVANGAIFADQTGADRFEYILNKDGFRATATIVGANAATAANYGIFFIADRPCEVMEIREVHAVASSNGTVQVQRLQGTEAVGAGDDILPTALSTSSTANTVVTKTSQNRELANTILSVGDRLALESAGTLTNLSHLVVQVYLIPLGKGDYR